MFKDVDLDSVGGMFICTSSSGCHRVSERSEGYFPQGNLINDQLLVTKVCIKHPFKLKNLSVLLETS